METDLSLDYTPERRAELEENVAEVLAEIKAASQDITPFKPARLVPISKIKPASDIKALYDAGHRHFGENYIQELADKAPVLPNDIKWHFVGALQSNKAKLAASIPNLHLLETLSSIKVADLLQKNLSAEQTLNVYIQVNTSGEDAKSGLPPLTSSSSPSDPLPELALHVIRNCDRLHLLGLMTIGSWDHSHEDMSKPNPDFSCLTETRDQLARILKDEGHESKDELELSMGMSADYAKAIKEGSSSVRVGTKIFGERPKKQ